MKSCKQTLHKHKKGLRGKWNEAMCCVHEEARRARIQGELRHLGSDGARILEGARGVRVATMHPRNYERRR